MPNCLDCGCPQRDELRNKYRLAKSPEDARAGWEEVYESSLHACMHGANCKQGSDCQARALRQGGC